MCQVTNHIAQILKGYVKDTNIKQDTPVNLQ